MDNILLTTNVFNVSLLQGLLLALVVFVFAIDSWLEGFFIFRPIIVSTVAGIILGDLTTGLMAGGLVELAFIGITPVGGTTPPDPIMTSVMTVVIAKTTGQDVATAFALAIPFGLLMQFIGTAVCTFYSFANRTADKYAKTGEVDKIVTLGIRLTALYAFVYAVVAFLSTYVMQDVMKTVVSSLPTYFIHGLQVAGGLIPAVGFAMLLNVMLKARYFAYLLIGFVFVCFIPFANVLPVAIVGLAFALMEYFRMGEKGKEGGEGNEGI